MPALSILSVSFRSEVYLEENLSLAASLNPGSDFEWIVVNNDPARPFPPGGKGPGFTVLAGPPPGQDRHRIKGGASYHHAEGLNLGLAAVRSRYLLVLDPDFYLLEPGWIGKVLARMEARGLSFLGSVWNPQDPLKPRYFPSVHCMFIDLEKVGLSSLDFTPELDVTNRRKKLLDRFRVPKPIRSSLLVGGSRDTGYRILRDFGGRRDHPCEIFQPICLDGSFVAAWRAALRNPLRRLVPDRLSRLPLREGYLAGPEATSERDAGWKELGWEGFNWRGGLFAVHLRNFGRGPRDTHRELAVLRAFLDGRAL